MDEPPVNPLESRRRSAVCGESARVLLRPIPLPPQSADAWFCGAHRQDGA